jgi:hypothetical protein
MNRRKLFALIGGTALSTVALNVNMPHANAWIMWLIRGAMLGSRLKKKKATNKKVKSQKKAVKPKAKQPQQNQKKQPQK